jgi:hypothetical protein
VGLISDNDLWKELGQLRRKVSTQEEQIARQEQIILLLNQEQDGAAGQLAPLQSPANTIRKHDPTKLSKLGE